MFSFESLSNVKLLKTVSNLPIKTLSWLGGFLDGDGHIGCRIVKKNDYAYGFQLRPEISFTQKGIRGQYVFPYIKKLFGNVGGIRDKGGGVWVYEIQGRKDVCAILSVLGPYILVKRVQVHYALHTIRYYDLGLSFRTLSENSIDRSDFVTRSIV